MKKARDDKPIKTIPEGAYECGTTNPKDHPDKERYMNQLATDIQNNGYPKK